MYAEYGELCVMGLLVLLCCCFAAWAGLAQWELSRARRRLAVAFSIIGYWRRMAEEAERDGGPLSPHQLAARIASRPLTREHHGMMRKLLRTRSASGRR